jgi:cell division protein FtsL
MAKGVKRKVGGQQGGRGGRVMLVLVGFVVLATGVMLRRVYGIRQAKEISEMVQRREALVSEQLKLQDAIRTASDRKHIMEMAQSRLGMKMPELNQVIDLPRRPLPSGRDSLSR